MRCRSCILLENLWHTTPHPRTPKSINPTPQNLKCVNEVQILRTGAQISERTVSSVWTNLQEMQTDESLCNYVFSAI